MEEKRADGLRALVRDVKELLLGVGLVLVSVALSCLGIAAVFLSGYYGGIWEVAAVGAWFAAAVFLLCGIAYLLHGWRAHRPAENEALD